GGAVIAGLLAVLGAWWTARGIVAEREEFVQARVQRRGDGAELWWICAHLVAGLLVSALYATYGRAVFSWKLSAAGFGLAWAAIGGWYVCRRFWTTATQSWLSAAGRSRFMAWVVGGLVAGGRPLPPPTLLAPAPANPPPPPPRIVDSCPVLSCLDLARHYGKRYTEASAGGYARGAVHLEPRFPLSARDTGELPDGLSVVGPSDHSDDRARRRHRRREHLVGGADSLLSEADQVPGGRSRGARGRIAQQLDRRRVTARVGACLRGGREQDGADPKIGGRNGGLQ